MGVFELLNTSTEENTIAENVPLFFPSSWCMRLVMTKHVFLEWVIQLNVVVTQQLVLRLMLVPRKILCEYYN